GYLLQALDVLAGGVHEGVRQVVDALAQADAVDLLGGADLAGGQLLLERVHGRAGDVEAAREVQRPERRQPFEGGEVRVLYRRVPEAQARELREPGEDGEICDGAAVELQLRELCEARE